MRLQAGMVLLGLAVMGGCFGGGENKVTSSGDPEADRRAEMRVGSGGGDGAEPDLTLYHRLGGEAGVRAIVDDMAERVIADPRVNFERRDVKTNWLGDKRDIWKATPENVENFKHHMVEFLTLAAGGPAEYTGREMRAVHEGMKITNNEFDAMVGDLRVSMTRVGMATREMKDVLAIVESTRKQIVEQR